MMKSSWLKDSAVFIAVLLLGFSLVYGVRYSIKTYEHSKSERPAIVSQQNLSEHFLNADDKVVIYTTQWCRYCGQAKEYLEQLNVSFVEYDVETSEQAVKDRYIKLGKKGVPKILIGEHLITGYYPEEIHTILQRYKLI